MMKRGSIRLSSCVAAAAVRQPVSSKIIANPKYAKILSFFGLGLSEQPPGATFTSPKIVDEERFNMWMANLQQRKKKLNLKEPGMYSFARELRKILRAQHTAKEAKEKMQKKPTPLSPKEVAARILSVQVPIVAPPHEKFNRCTALIKSQAENARIHEDPKDATLELTADQRAVVQLALEGYNLFVGGYAGTGKSFVIRRLVANLRAKALAVLVTATTGLASVNVAGSTFHAAFNLSHENKNSLSISASSLRQLDVLVIDEISMMPSTLLDSFSAAAQRARGSSEPFGGIQVILSGDFMQLLSPCGGAPAFQANCFREHILPVALTQPMRQQLDPAFFTALNKLRMGGDIPEAILKRSFKDSSHVPRDAVRLFPTRREARAYNSEQLLKLRTAARHFAPVFLESHQDDEAKKDFDDLRGSDWSAPLEILVDHSSDNTAAAKTAATSPTEHFIELISNAVGVPKAHVAVVSKQKCFQNGKGLVPWYEKVRTLPMTMRLQGTMPLHGTQQAAPVPSPNNVRYLVKVKLSPASGKGDDADKETATLLNKISQARGVVKAKRGGQTSKAAIKFHKASALAAAMRGKSGRSIAKGMYARALNADPTLESKTLKVGCRVMLLRNISPTLVNGSLGTVNSFVSLSRDKKMYPKLMKDKFFFDAIAMLGTKFQFVPRVKFDSGECCVIPWIEVPFPQEQTGGGGESSSIQSALTMPLVPAYAFTVHKVQGLTLPTSMLMCCRNLWACEHLLYVATSRVRTLQQVHFLNLEKGHLAVNQLSKEFSESLPAASHVLKSLSRKDQHRDDRKRWVKAAWTVRMES